MPETPEYPCTLPPEEATISQKICYLAACSVYQDSIATCNLISDPTERLKCIQEVTQIYNDTVDDCIPE